MDNYKLAYTGAQIDAALEQTHAPNTCPDVVALKGKSTGYDSGIESLNTDMATVKGALEQALTDITTNEDNIEALETKVDSLQASAPFAIPFAANGDGIYCANDSNGLCKSVASMCWAQASIEINLTGNAFANFAGDTMVLPTGSDNTRNQIIFPIDKKLTGIAMNAELYAGISLNAGVSRVPFVAVALAPAGSKSFVIQQDSVTFPDETTFTDSAAAGTSCYKSVSGLDISIPAGTQVLIVGGWYGAGGTAGNYQITQYWVYFNGSIYLE